MEKPDNDSDWESEEEIEENRESSEVFFCDVCEQDFYSRQFYEKHMSKHRVCGLDGCQYTAHEKMIEKHIRMQHTTGLYEKIRNVSTPEDIAKWIEERKLKYPSKENVQERYERQEEMLKRGEKIKERKNRFGKDKTRLSRIRQKRPLKKKTLKVHRPQQKLVESLINEKDDWNGTMFPFKGTKELYQEDSIKEVSDYDDDEWSTEAPNTAVTVKLNNALGALMGAYMSDDEEDNVSPSQSVQQDNDAPTEEKIQRQPLEYPNEEPKKVNVRRNKKRKSLTGKKHNKVPKLDEAKALESGFSRLKFFKRRVTLLEKLLDSEIRHERNVLLQCVQFVVGNNFFRSS